MKIMELANAVHEEHRRLRGMSGDFSIPININIYISIDYYHECMMEIKGPVPAMANELFHNGTIMGYKVHKVIGDTGHKAWEVFGVRDEYNSETFKKLYGHDWSNDALGDSNA